MLELYRGDSLYNLRSKPGLYRTDGITSAAMGAGGDPRNIETFPCCKPLSGTSTIP